jgi:16S rRNA (guanine966-N2)-methyltransferase
MRIVAGDWRGRTLKAPPGSATRPTADRVRQALFDMLIHARWAGPDVLEDAIVLDAFAGSGALGLEALSRGAAQATFMENDRASLTALRANIAACGAQDRCRVVPTDVLTAPLGSPCGLVFLDPPYSAALVPQAIARLRASGWIAPNTLVVAETGRGDTPPALGELLAERMHGMARVSIWRETK